MVLFGVTIVAAWGGRVNPQLWSLPSVLTLTLPYLAITTFFVTLVWAICRRWVIMICGVLTLIVCWTPIREAFPFGHSCTASGGETFTLMTYNAMHSIDFENPESQQGTTMRAILDADADIVCLQEVGGLNRQSLPATPDALIDSLAEHYPYRLFDEVRCLGIMSKFPVRYAPVEEPLTFTYAAYVVDINNRPLNVVNLHLASYRLSDKEREVMVGIRSVKGAESRLKEFKGSILSKMKASFRERAQDADSVRLILDKLQGSTIVCGDFNDVPASWSWRIVKGDDFKDAYAYTNFGNAITYHAHRMYFHIDQVFYRGSLQPLKVDCMHIGVSDHYPLFAEFELSSK